jgi:hypothetical protein
LCAIRRPTRIGSSLKPEDWSGALVYHFNQTAITAMPHDRPEIQDWMRQHGYSDEEIAKILLKLDEFDSKVNRESLFDAIETGELDIDALIKDVLKDSG